MPWWPRCALAWQSNLLKEMMARGKNQIRKSTSRRMQIVIGAQIFWIGVVCVVGAWWGILLLRQAGKIAELEVASGVASSEAHIAWLRTQRMLYGESTAFFVLAVVSSAFLFWLYWLDMRRARSIQAFFASVTHELRTPLTSIRLQAESLAEQCNESQKTLVTRLLEDTTRLEGQVERTLELARLEGGGPVFVQSLRLKPWLSRLAETWRESYGSRVEIELRIAELTVEADPTALQIVLKNLVENSLRHARKDRVHIIIDARAESGRACIAFRDDGTGYVGNQRDLGKLFHRGSSSQGSGVGLYLVRALMSRMGGRARFGCAPSTSVSSTSVSSTSASSSEGGFVTELELRNVPELQTLEGEALRD
jgi:signal transduction histidine kinase